MTLTDTMRLDWEAKERRVAAARNDAKKKRDRFRRERRARGQMRRAGALPAHEGETP
jgi:hypothetical protein